MIATPVFLVTVLALCPGVRGTVGPTPVPDYKRCSSYSDSDAFTAFGLECDGIWQFDTNGDKRVTVSELHRGMKSIFSDLEYFSAYFLFRDLNADGVFDESDEPLVFDRMDLDKDGDVTLTEYFTEYQMLRGNIPWVMMSQVAYIDGTTNTIRELGPTDLEYLLGSYMPHDDAGSVTKADFITVYTTKFTMLEYEAEVYFDQLDTNSDDVITRPEMASIFVNLDTNGDGRLQLSEIMEISKYPDGSTAS